MSTSITTDWWQTADVGTAAVTETQSGTGYDLVTTSSASWVDVPNLSVTMTTDGSPVHLNAGLLDASVANGTGADASFIGYMQIVRSGWGQLSRASMTAWILAGKSFGAPIAIYHIDGPAAGTYTWKVQWQSQTNFTWSCESRVLQVTVFKR